MNRNRRWLVRHRSELVLIAILTGIATGCLFWVAGLESPSKGQTVLEKFALAILVAVIVRSITLLFSASERAVSDYRSSKSEYEEAVEGAIASIWVSQTWLPGMAAQAKAILKPPRTDIRIMLASFKDESFIFPRILGREDVHDPNDAKGNVVQCAKSLKDLIPEGKLRFAYGHHPGWITIIDRKEVFWGPTPIHKDNNDPTESACWNRDSIDGKRGKFWLKQFNLLWKEYSHELKEEVPHNPGLRHLIESEQAT